LLIIRFNNNSTSQHRESRVAESELRFADSGPHTLKGIPGEWRLFAVAPD
jgi:hypothetical protein